MCEELKEVAGSSHSSALSAAQCLSLRAQPGEQTLFLGFRTEARTAGVGSVSQMYIVRRSGTRRRSQSHCARAGAMRSRSWEKEPGLSCPPSGLLWVPSTSWLGEACDPGSLWAQHTAGERRTGRWRAALGAGLPLLFCLQSLCNAKTLGKEAEEWPAWPF